MTVTASDNFQRVAANLGANWTNVLNGFTTNNNAKGTNAGTALNAAQYDDTQFTPDQSSTVVIGAYNGTTDFLGPAVRVLSIGGSTNLYIANSNSTTLQIQKVVAATNGTFGTITTLAGPISITGAPGDTVTLRIVGNTLTVDRNGVLNVLSYTDNSSPLLTGCPGILQFGNTATFSSFSASDIVTTVGISLNVVCVGDSITSGYGVATPYPNSLSVNESPNTIYNMGIASQMLASTSGAVIKKSMTAYAAGSIDPLFILGKTNVLVIWGSTNDIDFGGYTPAQAYSAMQVYVAARQAVGWKVVVVPNLSRTGSDANQLAYDALLSGGSAFYNALVSLPNTLVGLGAYSNVTYFQVGGIHPTQLSDTTIIAPDTSVAINGLLANSNNSLEVPNSVQMTNGLQVTNSLLVPNSLGGTADWS